VGWFGWLAGDRGNALIIHFKALQQPIPEGLPGTNSGALSRDRRLIIFQLENQDSRDAHTSQHPYPH